MHYERSHTKKFAKIFLPFQDTILPLHLPQLFQLQTRLSDKILEAFPPMIVIGSCGLYYLSILIVGLIMIFNPEVMENYNEMMEFALGGSEVLAIFAAVILAPINEECIMRGLILKNLQKYFSEPVVIILILRSSFSPPNNPVC